MSERSGLNILESSVVLSTRMFTVLNWSWYCVYAHYVGKEEETAWGKKQENGQAVHSWNLWIVLFSCFHAHPGAIFHSIAIMISPLFCLTNSQCYALFKCTGTWRYGTDYHQPCTILDVVWTGHRARWPKPGRTRKESPASQCQVCVCRIELEGYSAS